MRTIRLSVDGMRCRKCVRQATSRLRDLPGIITVTADRSRNLITLTGDVTDGEALRALSGTTFQVRIVDSTSIPAPSSASPEEGRR